jgi:hypothetical protein
VENPVKSAMPARKPSALLTRHDTLADTETRSAAESAVTPARRLPESLDATLTGHPIAAREWRRLMKIYNSLDAEIVSRLDMGMLLDYCILIEQLEELDMLRASAVAEWKALKKIIDDVKKKIDENPDEKIDLKQFTKAAEAVNWAYNKIITTDGRVDRKRALIFQLRQSLYLTPRSRAGVAPTEKPKEEPASDLDRLLDS